ncbi:MAG: acetyltransferase, partial [Nitrosomonadales bacterium]
ETPSGRAYLLPDRPWSRRVSGAFGNHLARVEPALAHAVLTHKANGGYLVSVRAPRLNPAGADDLCRQFETGGGRKSAAGINHLPESELARFLASFGTAFNRENPS